VVVAGGSSSCSGSRGGINSSIRSAVVWVSAEFRRMANVLHFKYSQNHMSKPEGDLLHSCS
jgi:hypothetical protein